MLFCSISESAVWKCYGQYSQNKECVPPPPFPYVRECSYAVLLNCGQMYTALPRNFSGETKQRVYQTPCEMQRAFDLLRPDYTKEAIVLGFGAAVQQKENGVRAYSDGFLQTRA